ncbi:MAG: CHAT domain-containing protein [Symploca sp. SIO1B1]|nr:CHAT domain-containing protein [Symploca sp. SIO1B1]
MFESFTRKAIQVVMLAQEEVRRLGHQEVTTLQLLLGLIAEGTGVAAKILRAAGVNLKNARLEVEKIQGRGAGSGTEIPFNNHTKQIFEFSLAEADQLNHSNVDTEHLLLGLLEQVEGGAIIALQNLGVESTQIHTQVLHILVNRDNENAAHFLQNTTANHNESKRIKTHLNLIQKLLKHSDSSELYFLKNYSNIIDSGLIIALEGVALILAQQGDQEGAIYLQNIASQLTQKESEKNNNEENILDSLSNSRVTSSSQLQFVLQVIETVINSDGNIQQLNLLLPQNLDKLDDNFARVLRSWALPTLADAEPEEAQHIARAIQSFGEFLLLLFQQGDAHSKLEIAQTSFEIAATIFTEVEFPEQFTQIEDLICLKFLSQIIIVISECQQDTQPVYSLLAANQDKLNDRFIRVLQDWGTAQLSVAGNLTFASQRLLLQGFAEAIVYFGSIVYEFSQGDQGNQEINIEIGIACYEVAATFFTRATFPPIWASIQKCLGGIYRERIRGDHPENLKLAQQYFQAALEVFAAPEFTEQRIQTQQELDRVVREAQQLEEGSNSEASDDSNGTEVAEFHIAQESQEVQASENEGNQTHPIISLPSNSQENQELETFSNEGLESLQKDIDVKDTDLEETQQELVIPYPQIYAQEKYSVDETDESSKKFIESAKRRLADFNEKIDRDFAEIRQKYTRDVGKQSYLEIDDSPIITVISNNPELKDFFSSLIGRVIERLSTILKAQGKQDYAEMLKDFAAEFTSEAIFANLSSSADDENTTASSIDLNTPEFVKFFSSTEFAEIIETLSVEFLGIISANYTSDDNAIDPMLQKNVIEALWTRLLPLISKLASTSEWSNNEKINQFFENYSATPLAVGLHQYNEFWGGVIEAIQRSEGNLEEVVYPILLPNLDKLNSFSALYLGNLVKSAFSILDQDEAWELASICCELSRLLLEFPHGDNLEKLEIAISFNLAALEVIPREISLEAYAFVQFILGPCYHKRIKGDPASNLEAAIKCYHKASECFSKQNNLYLWAVNLMHLGNAYQERLWGEGVENKELAIKAYHEALEEPEFKTKYPEMWAMAQMNLGNAYRDRTNNISTWEDKNKNIEDAIICYKNALNIFNREAFPGEWAMIQTNLAVARMQQPQSVNTDTVESPITVYQELLQRIFTREAFPEQWGITQTNLGIAYRNEKNWQPAINCFQNALQIFKRTTNPRNYVKAITLLGSTYLEAKDFYNAYSSLAFAINTTESLHTEIISGDEIKRRFSEKVDLCYQYTIKACLELAATEPHYYDRAIEYVERSKSRSLVELLDSRNLLPKGDIPEETLQRLQNLRQEIATEQRRLSNIAREVAASDYATEYGFSFESATPDYTRLNELQQKLDTLIDSEIYLIDPNFRLTQKVLPISFSEIKNLLSDNQTAIVEWYIPSPLQLMQAVLRGEKIYPSDLDITNEGTIYTFITTFEEEHPIVLQTPPENYLDLWSWLGEYLKAYDYQKDEWANLMPSQLKKLARILEIDKVVSYIPNAKQVILIPHKLLHLFPLHALPLNDGSCLLEGFSQGVRYAPNCQVLQLTQSSQKTEFDRFLAIQNPTEDLIYADLEVQVIRQYFQPTNKVLPSQKATKEALLKQRLNSVYYLYFSSHGYFNLLIPLKSGLLLANCYTSDTPTSADLKRYVPLPDGTFIDLTKCLTLEDTFNLNLRKCRLVTISACETGLTDVSLGADEYVGLPSGFLYAGSPNVVASLWKVNELSTALLMIKLYENLHEQQKQQVQLNVAIALNQAQLWLRDATKEQLEQWASQLPLDDEQELQLDTFFYKLESNSKPFESPYHWAAFCAIGQ